MAVIKLYDLARMTTATAPAAPSRWLAKPLSTFAGAGVSNGDGALRRMAPTAKSEPASTRRPERRSRAGRSSPPTGTPRSRFPVPPRSPSSGRRRISVRSTSTTGPSARRRSRSTLIPTRASIGSARTTSASRRTAPRYSTSRPPGSPLSVICFGMARDFRPGRQRSRSTPDRALPS